MRPDGAAEPGDNLGPVEKWQGCRKLSRPKETQTEMDMDMKLSPRKQRRSEAGFTLIDMLFVVALIGLLASMAIPG